MMHLPAPRGLRTVEFPVGVEANCFLNEVSGGVDAKSPGRHIITFKQRFVVLSFNVLHSFRISQTDEQYNSFR